MHLYIIFGIFIIVDFALAAPVLVEEKFQAGADLADIPGYPVVELGKRGDTWGEIEEVGGKYIENWFAPPKGSSAAHGSPSLVPPKPGHVSTNAPASDPGPSAESDHSLAGMHTPLSSPVNPTWFHLDNKLLGAHAPQLNTGPSNPSAGLGSDHRLVAVEPPSPTKGSSTESGIEMAPVPPSSRVFLP